MHSHSHSPLVLASTLLTLLSTPPTAAQSQCVTPGYVPCNPAGANLGGVPTDNFGDSGFWSSLQGAASDPIQKRSLAEEPEQQQEAEAIQGRSLSDVLLAPRQGALCCAPDPDKYCLLITDGNIPFCYDTDTTRYVFSDESFGFLANGTYYDSDGDLLVNFQDGTYDDGTDGGATSTFAPVSFSSAAATGSTPPPTATRSGEGKVTSLAAAGQGSGSGSGTSTTGFATATGSGSSSSGSTGGPSSAKGNEAGSGGKVGVWGGLALVVGGVVFAAL